MTQETDQRNRPHLRAAIPLMIRLDESGDVKAAEYNGTLLELSSDGLRCSANLPRVSIGTELVVVLKIPLWLFRWPLRLRGVVAGVVPEESQWIIEFGAPRGWRKGLLQLFLHRIRAAARKLQEMHGSRSQLAEAFRMIQLGLEPFGGGRARIIVVTSSTMGEGKSFVACGLAATLVRAGHQVLLADADLDRPSLHEVFRVNPSPGVAHLLGLKANQPFDFESLVQETRSGISVLPAGNDGTQSGLDSGHSIARFMDILKQSGRQFVIVDSPPLLMRARAAQLASAADDVLLTVRAGRSYEREVQQAKMLLDRHGARLRGVVLNDSSSTLHDYSDGRPREMDASLLGTTESRSDDVDESSPSSSSMEVHATPRP